MDKISKEDRFDGKGDVNAFIKKMELYIALKEYTGEKAAQALASHLMLPAFNVYMRMTVGDQKDVEKIKKELREQYEVGKINREEAQSLLNLRVRKDGEALRDYAFDVKRLAALAYPTFNAANLDIIGKDHFVKGLHAEMQVKVKSLADFAASNFAAVVMESVRLELAGEYPGRSAGSIKLVNAACHTSDDSLNPILSRLDKLENMLFQDRSNGSVNRVQQRGSRGSGKGRGTPRQCRNCDSTEHLVRQCPSRFCPACGGRGHDAWEKSCPKYR